METSLPMPDSPTIPLPAVLSAAQRLRRVEAREDGAAVYRIEKPTLQPGPWGSYDVETGVAFKVMEDKSLLANFLLARLPREPKPEAIVPLPGQTVWVVVDHEVQHVMAAEMPDGEIKVSIEGASRFFWESTEVYPAYPTEASARLAAEWQRFEDFFGDRT